MSIGEILCFRVYLTNRAYDPGQENQSSQKKISKKSLSSGFIQPF